MNKIVVRMKVPILSEAKQKPPPKTVGSLLYPYATFYQYHSSSTFVKRLSSCSPVLYKSIENSGTGTVISKKVPTLISLKFYEVWKQI